MGNEDADPTATTEEVEADPTVEVVAAEETEADPTATAEEEGEDLLEDLGKGKKADAAPDSNAALAVAIEKLSASLKPGQAPLTPEQQEQEWTRLETETGMTRQQLVRQDVQIRRAAVLASLDANREVGRTKINDILGDDETLKADVEKSMATLPPEIQANPKAWADAAYLVLGRKTTMGGKTTTATTTKRVIAGGQTTTRTTATKAAPKKDYTAMEQHIIARQFNGKAEEYEKFKANKPVDSDSRVTGGSNNADKELERLTAENT